MDEFGETPTIYVWPTDHEEGDPLPDDFYRRLWKALREAGCPGWCPVSAVGGPPPLETVLAEHRELIRGVNKYGGGCWCGWRGPEAEFAGHVAAAVRSWLGGALVQPEVVEAAAVALRRSPLLATTGETASAALAAAGEALTRTATDEGVDHG